MSEGLERRYRRLLAWYPAAYRAEYGEEMLGVLLSGAREGQRYPAPAEAANLIRSALWMRLAQGVGGVADPRWSSAGATLGVLGSLLVFAFLAGFRIADYLSSLLIYPGDTAPLYALGAWIEPLLWLSVAVLAASRRLVVADAVAWAGVLAEAVPLGLRYPDNPVSVLTHMPLLAFAVTIAAGLAVAAAHRDQVQLPRQPIVLFGVSIVVIGAAPALDPLTTRVGHFGNVTTIDLWPGGGGYLPGLFPGTPMEAAGLARLLAYLLALVIALVALRRTDGGLRRRLTVLLTPAASLVVMIRLTFGGFIASSPRFYPPVLLVPEQWVALVAVPLLVFLAGVAWVRRQERRLHLIRLGELAERQPRPTEPA